MPAQADAGVRRLGLLQYLSGRAHPTARQGRHRVAPSGITWLAPVSRRELIQRLHRLRFEGPFTGGRHEFMVRGGVRLILPYPHHQEISADLLVRLLRQAGQQRGLEFCRLRPASFTMLRDASFLPSVNGSFHWQTGSFQASMGASNVRPEASKRRWEFPTSDWKFPSAHGSSNVRPGASSERQWELPMSDRKLPSVDGSFQRQT
jgi:hypothetical protein